MYYSHLENIQLASQLHLRFALSTYSQLANYTTQLLATYYCKMLLEGSIWKIKYSYQACCAVDASKLLYLQKRIYHTYNQQLCQRKIANQLQRDGCHVAMQPQQLYLNMMLITAILYFLSWYSQLLKGSLLIFTQLASYFKQVKYCIIAIWLYPKIYS